jgi:peptidoglycan hydrolase-like protein with peptidoglycan-binding domain
MMIRRTRLTPLSVPLALAAMAVLASACSSTISAADVSVIATVPVTSTTEAPTITDASTTTTEAPTTTDSTTTTEAPTTTTLPANVEVVGASAEPMPAVNGASGPPTVLIQQRLAQLGFWNGDAAGRYGFSTKQAVMAFQKYLGIKATGYVDPSTAALLTNFVEKAHGLSNDGNLVEVDKGRQLLFIVQNGKTVWTMNTSTGSGVPYSAPNKKDPTKIETGDAQTPAGLYKTNRERPDGWWDGDLGQIYRPKYFHNGIAIHGMTSVPNYPASHGCVRVSTQAMDFIWDSGLVPLGTPVWVHE